MINSLTDSGLLFAEYEALHSDIQKAGPIVEPLDTVKLAVTAESAQFPVTLSELIGIAPGVIIRGFSPLSGLSIKLDGERIAEAELILLGGEFALRVTHLHQSLANSDNKSHRLIDKVDSDNAKERSMEVK